MAKDYKNTNYHQDAIDAAARGDWNAVNTALSNRQEKINAQGGNDRGTSNAQILADLQKQYGSSSSGGGGSSSSSSTSGNRVTNLPGNAQPAQATQTPLAPAQPPALNQYGFRDNFDYTQALQDTNLTPEQRAQYIQERQNKIYTNYGGVEPNMTGSDQKFSQTSAGRGSGVTNTYRGIEYTRAPNTGMYGAPVFDSAVKNYKQGGVTYQTGPMMGRITDPNIIKNGYYISNGYTVFVNQDGYATKAVKGVADYTPHQDINAGNGTYNKSGAWTDNEMLTPDEVALIQSYRDAAAAGTMTWAEANQKANAIRSSRGYSIDNKGNVTDYGALTAVNDRRQQMGLDTNAENGSAAYYRYLMNTDTSPAAQAAGQVKTYQQFAQENGYDVSAPTGVNGKVPTVQTIPLPGNSVIGGSGSTGGGISGSGNLDMSPGTSDVYTPGNMGDYLNQWYQNAQQQQQNTIDFGTNQAILELLRNKQDAEAQYQEQRNQIAIDEAKAKDNQALYAEARGDKGGIGAAQYDAIMNTAAQNRLAVNSAQTKLATDTSRQIADLRAQGEYEKADALLTLSQQYLSQLMSLEQWAAEYNLSVAQFNASLKQWQAEFDLKVADILGSYRGQQTLSAKEFAFNQQQYADEQQAAQEKKLASAGEILLAAGIMPSASQLAAMGMTTTEAQSYITAQKVAAATAGKSGKGNGGGGGTKKMTKSTAEDMAEAGQFTDAVVNWFRTNGYTDKYLKETYGWNGVTLEKQRQQNIDTANAGTIKNDFDQMMRAITAQLASGKDDAFEVAKRNAELMMPGLSEEAQQAVLDVFARYGRPLKIVTD